MTGAQPLTTISVLHICELYDAALEDFDRIMALEDKVYPIIAERIEQGEQPNAGSKNQDRRK